MTEETWNKNNGKQCMDCMFWERGVCKKIRPHLTGELDSCLYFKHNIKTNSESK